MPIDVSSLSYPELLTLQADVARALTERRERDKADLRKRFEDEAGKLGLSLSDVVRVKGTAKPTTGKDRRGSVAAKYRHPIESGTTWTGRGKAPRWILDHEASGGRREDLLIT